MENFVITTENAADLPESFIKENEIGVLSLYYTIDGVTYGPDHEEEMPAKTFYQQMRNGSMPKTQQVNPDQAIRRFREILKQGKDILHVTLSSGISGSINSAMVAKQTLAEEFPDRKIYVVDSLGASSGYGLLMDRVADMRDSGMSLDDLAKWTEDNRLHLHHWFFSTDLTFYIKGGRVSKTAGFVGSVLNICPLLNMDNLGRLIPRYKIRTKKKVIKTIVDKMEEHAQDGLNYSGKCYISQSACYEDAKEVAELVEKRFPKLNGRVEINDIGTTIGSHTGPGTVALFFWGDERVD